MYVIQGSQESQMDSEMTVRTTMTNALV